MKKLVLLALIFAAPAVWGQFLVSPVTEIKSLDADLAQWVFPNELKAFVSLPEPDGRLYNGVPQAALTVMQGEFAVLSAEDGNFSVLSSAGAAPCTMVILRPSDNLALAHSHLDALTSTTESLSAMMTQLRLFSGAPVEAILAGLYSEAGLVRRIVADLRALGVTNIKFYRSSAIAIDKGGQIYFNGIYSDNVIPLPIRREALDAEIKSINANMDKKIQSASQQPGCDFNCIMNRIRRPLRQLYVSERN